MNLSFKVVERLNGKTLAIAESLTGGGIGAALTAVPGCSSVYKGGVISYTDEIKREVLGVPDALLASYGAVSAPVAEKMAEGVRKLLNVDIALSVTGLAGPDGDAFGHPVGTVFIGYQDSCRKEVRHFCFLGDRESVRRQTIETALSMILQYNG